MNRRLLLLGALALVLTVCACSDDDPVTPQDQDQVTAEDVLEYGMIPELIGRLPVLTPLMPLDVEAMVKILTEPKNAIIKQYEKLFEMDGITLSWDDKVLDYIVQKAVEFKLGARGLRSICEAIMMDAMFELPSKENATEMTIGIKYAREKLEKANLKRLKAA